MTYRRLDLLNIFMQYGTMLRRLLQQTVIGRADAEMRVVKK